jgi:hypothetical protein
MNFEDLGRVWQEQGTGDFQRRKIENLSTVRARAEKLLEGLHRNGTWIGLFTLALVAPVSVLGILDSPRPWMAGTGSLILVAWLVRMLIHVQRFGAPRSATPLPVRAAVESEVLRLRLLEQFWGRPPGWSPLAFLVGEILAFEGFRPAGVPRGTMTVFFYVALFALVAYTMGARGRDARKRVRPLREELESWLAGLEAFDFDRELGARRPEGTA